MAMASVPDPTCAPVRAASSLPAVDQAAEVSDKLSSNSKTSSSGVTTQRRRKGI